LLTGLEPPSFDVSTSVRVQSKKGCSSHNLAGVGNDEGQRQISIAGGSGDVGPRLVCRAGGTSRAAKFKLFSPFMQWPVQCSGAVLRFREIRTEPEIPSFVVAGRPFRCVLRALPRRWTMDDGRWPLSNHVPPLKSRVVPGYQPWATQRWQPCFGFLRISHSRRRTGQPATWLRSSPGFAADSTLEEACWEPRHRWGLRHAALIRTHALSRRRRAAEHGVGYPEALEISSLLVLENGERSPGAEQHLSHCCPRL
jgi:hypothetical protein